MTLGIACRIRTGCRYAIGVVALASLASCGGEPAPTTQLSLAQASIDAAAHDGAQRRDPQDLAAAQDKLSRATSAGSNTNARRLAEEADIDAQLAAARSRSAAATGALDQLQGNAPPAQPAH